MRQHEFTAPTPARTVSGRTGQPVDPAQCDRAARDARRAARDVMVPERARRSARNGARR